jgi:hypothetical protein
MSETPRVIESTLRGFVCAYPGYDESPFRLGQFVAVREGPVHLFGVVADSASGPEDPTRPLGARGNPGQSAADVLADEPSLRLLLRTRVTVVTCGYIDGELVRTWLPPIPAPLLGRVEQASDAEVVRLTADAGFLEPLIASSLCDDAVIAATLRSAADASGPQGRAFTVSAGKELARLLKADPARLTSILRGVAR